MILRASRDTADYKELMNSSLETAAKIVIKQTLDSM